MNDDLLSRRELIDLAARAALLPGATVFFSAWLKAASEHHHGSGSNAPPQPDWLHKYEPKFFSSEEFTALQAFTEILIPTDEDPGAREAYCAHFIDFVLQASHEMPQMQSNWGKAMEAIKATGFYTAEAKRQAELVTEISRPEIDHEVRHPAFFAYMLIKHQAAFAFYTSRVGMIDVLDYRGNTYNITFPGCDHREHRTV